MFFVYKHRQCPNMAHFIELWQQLARENGLEGIYFVAVANSLYNATTAKARLEQILEQGFDAMNVVNAYKWPNPSLWYRFKKKVFFKTLGWVPDIRPYRYEQFQCPLDGEDKVLPSILPNWDHTPRSGKKGVVLQGSTPDAFRSCLHRKLEIIKDKPADKRFLIVKSWNEWAEGNHLEPDLRFGKAYLEVLKEELSAK